MQDDDHYPSRNTAASPRPRTRRVLTVRMLAGKTAWLDGQLYWREGQVSWETPEGSLRPSASDLSSAQRALHQLRRYPISSRLALGDADTWIERRQERLELAKSLARLSGPSLEEVAAQARTGKPAALAFLVSLLRAEAHCVNRLPLSPAATLAACRERAEPPLQDLLASPAPSIVRALAAMTLGAVHRTLPHRQGPDLTGAPDAGWLARAYRLGRQSGLPEVPPLASALLADEDGMELIHRCASATGPDQPFAPEAEILRELLASGVKPRRVVALTEALADARLVAERLLDHRELLPPLPQVGRRVVAARLDEEAAETIELFRQAYERYARADADPHAIRLATRIVVSLLDCRPDHRRRIPTILSLMEKSVTLLPADRLRDWFAALEENEELFWTVESHYTASGPSDLSAAWQGQVHPALLLAARTGDMMLPVEALNLDALKVLVHHGCERNLEFHRYLLSLVQRFGAGVVMGGIWSIARALERAPDFQATRQALNRLIDAAAPLPVNAQFQFIWTIFDEFAGSNRSLLALLSVLPQYLRSLLTFRPGGEHRYSDRLTEAAVALASARPDDGPEWFAQLVAALSRWLDQEAEIDAKLDRLRSAIAFALALAGDDRDEFLAIVRTGIKHEELEPLYTVAEGLAALTRFPGLRTSVAQVFQRQPRRCTALLARLGLSARLGEAVLAPLAELALPGELPETPDWAPVLRLAPDLATTAAEYVRSRRLLGTSDAPPRAVIRALALPSRLARELHYLEARCARGEGSPGMAARAASLRDRLAAAERLASLIEQEVRGHLTEAAAEAGIAAAERQVLRCFHMRLEQFAGPLPDELELTDEWLNAALLSAGIKQNRKLLRRLLRQALAGNPRWIERQPDNARYLAALKERGVDVEAWLAARPRRYPCAGVPGGSIRIYLERDPLRVLQMGNYFDTCLSFNGCNSFSTVANACELNKRVIYAVDNDGRVVGRKLIGIDEAGSLVGFHTYTALSQERGADELRAAIRHFALGFAAHCNLTTAEYGTVPRLFAGRWYDDGSCPWDNEGPGEPGKNDREPPVAGLQRAPGPTVP